MGRGLPKEANVTRALNRNQLCRYLGQQPPPHLFQHRDRDENREVRRDPGKKPALLVKPTRAVSMSPFYIPVGCRKGDGPLRRRDARNRASCSRGDGCAEAVGEGPRPVDGTEAAIQPTQRGGEERSACRHLLAHVEPPPESRITTPFRFWAGFRRSSFFKEQKGSAFAAERIATSLERTAAFAA